MVFSPTSFPAPILFLGKKLLLIALVYSVTSCLTGIESSDPVLNVVSKELGSSAYPLKECQGDCFGDDSNCEKGLRCANGADSSTTPGCFGIEFAHIDFCFRPTDSVEVQQKKGNNESSAKSIGAKKIKQLMLIKTTISPPPPLKSCRGHCVNDASCDSGLTCFKRASINQIVPGCAGPGLPGVNYCYWDTTKKRSGNKIQSDPTPDSSAAPTYVPGQLTVYENGLILSQGLKSRIIAESFKPVRIDKGIQQASLETFHPDPDAAACFIDPKSPTPNRPNYKYVSNSESEYNGGVGAIEFDYDGNVLGYERLLRGTVYNCGGGKTFYNTWMSCEEVENGQVWEVIPYPRDDYERKNQARQTLLGRSSYGMYESAAYDNRNPTMPRFFISTDEEDGPLIRYTPSSSSVEYARATGDYTQLLHAETDKVKTFGRTNYRPAVYEYLMLDPGSKTFTWTRSLDEGKDNAWNYHPNTEGVDARDGKLYFVCKFEQRLFVLNLDAGTFQSGTTASGSFDGEPDQIVRLLSGPGSIHSSEGDEILYFTEDGDYGSGVHGRDRQGRYFTIVTAGAGMDGETSGLAFSPNNMRMYVAFQQAGKVFEISRTDGKPFGGQRLDIKYHSGTSSANRARKLSCDKEKI